MTSLSTSRSEAPLPAHLLIHADGDIDPRRRPADSPLARLLALYSDGDAHARATLRIDVHDMTGQALCSFEDAAPLVDVLLPEGTYHVTTQLGQTRRGYTMTLKAGEAFDLYLRLTRTGK